MTAKWKPVFVVVAAIAAIVGVLGVLDLKSAPYAGYFGGPNNDVTRVFPGSPAADAGLEVGDVLQSVGGIAVTDTKALTRRSRAEVGETRTFVVDRNGTELELDLTYSDLPARQRSLALAGALIGFCFLLLPLWAFHRAESGSTFILALFGVAFGIAFLPGPYSQSFLLRSVAGAFATSCVVLGFAFMVHYLMQYPKPGRFLDKGWSRKLIYGPAILLAVFFLYLAAAQPDATSGFNRVIGLLVGIYVVGFFGWAIVAIIRRFLQAGPADRAAHGLGLMLFGTLAGLLPVTFSSLVGALAPQVGANLPGVQFFFLTMMLIPICFAVAAVRSADG